MPRGIYNRNKTKRKYVRKVVTVPTQVTVNGTALDKDQKELNLTILKQKRFELATEVTRIDSLIEAMKK